MKTVLNIIINKFNYPLDDKQKDYIEHYLMDYAEKVSDKELEYKSDNFLDIQDEMFKENPDEKFLEDIAYNILTNKNTPYMFKDFNKSQQDLSFVHDSDEKNNVVSIEDKLKKNIEKEIKQKASKKNGDTQSNDVRFTNKLKSHPVCLTTKGNVSLEMEKVINSMPGDDVINAEVVLSYGDKLEVYFDGVKKDLIVLYEDDKILVVNKPSGIENSSNQSNRCNPLLISSNNTSRILRYPISFHRPVVNTTTDTRHTLAHSRPHQPTVKRFICILKSSVTMKDRLSIRIVENRSFKSIQYQLVVVSLTYNPCNRIKVVQIQNST